MTEHDHASWPAKQKAFIVSTGRTGTDFFTSLFNDHISNTWSLHEPKPAFRARSYQLVGRSHTIFEKYYFKIPRKRRHKDHPEKWYIETNYHLFAAMPLIRDAFADSFIIHIVRDGREVVTSWLNKYRYITNDHITPYDIPGDPAQHYWNKWNPLQKLSWYWRTVNEIVETQQPDLWLHFEKIFQNHQDDLAELLKRMEGIDYDWEQVRAIASRKVNKTQQPFFPHYVEWPLHWQDQFLAIAGDTMERYGYRIE
ncbi:MAG: hypothetical protein BRD50_05300 [Bacteroidetes bacterium SW_11_45_7]|nr:MAG: hypothetical protein BRD50_05300 [Bacteroidetes bacterium SW_11_45_7]